MDIRLLQIIQDVCKCPGDKLAEDVRLRDVQGWDSLAHMELIAALEASFSLQFTGDEIADMQTVGDIWKIISTKHHTVRT